MGGHTPIAWGTYPWSILRPLPTWSCHTSRVAIFVKEQAFLTKIRALFGQRPFEPCFSCAGASLSAHSETINQFAKQLNSTLHVHVCGELATRFQGGKSDVAESAAH